MFSTHLRMMPDQLLLLRATHDHEDSYSDIREAVDGLDQSVCVADVQRGSKANAQQESERERQSHEGRHFD